MNRIKLQILSYLVYLENVNMVPSKLPPIYLDGFLFFAGYVHNIHKQSESLSNIFLLLWLSGDIFNLTSSILLQQLPTQIYLGIYWMCFDVILLSSHFFFKYSKKQYQPSKYGTKFTKTEIFVYIVLICVVVNNIFWAGFYNEDLIEHEPENYSYCHVYDDLPHDSPQYVVGNVLAYITIVLYTFSRPSQIYKNYKLKTRCLKNLSIVMFYFTSGGNITQLISMFVYSQDSDYLIQKIPFVLAAFLPASCDIIVICQYYYYKKMAKKYSIIGDNESDSPLLQDSQYTQQ